MCQGRGVIRITKVAVICLIASFCNDTTQNIVLFKLVNLFKYRYGQKCVFCFIFSASGWNIRFSWDTNIMRTVVCVRARYRSFLLTGTINFYESLNMHIAHNTTACAQNKYTQTKGVSVTDKALISIFLSLNLLAYAQFACWCPCLNLTLFRNGRFPVGEFLSRTDYRGKAFHNRWVPAYVRAELVKRF